MLFYIIILILILYYTGLYENLPEPLPGYFSVLDDVLPGEVITDDLDGIYESENTTTNTTYFIIAKDGTDFIYLKSNMYLTDTDDFKKFKNKQIDILRKNVFTSNNKQTIQKINNKYMVDGDIELKKDNENNVCLLLIKNGEPTPYIKITNN